MNETESERLIKEIAAEARASFGNGEVAVLYSDPIDIPSHIRAPIGEVVAGNDCNAINVAESGGEFSGEGSTLHEALQNCLDSIKQKA